MLRPWRSSDAPAVLEICQDPEIARWVTIPQPFLAADADAFIENAATMWRDGTGAPFAIVDAGDRQDPRRGDSIRPRGASGDCRPVARNRCPRPRRRDAGAPTPHRLDVRDDAGHPGRLLHHGRQRAVGADGRARRLHRARASSARGTSTTAACRSTASPTPGCGTTSSANGARATDSRHQGVVPGVPRERGVDLDHRRVEEQLHRPGSVELEQTRRRVAERTSRPRRRRPASPRR